jgi:hypothetical protein
VIRDGVSTHTFPSATHTRNTRQQTPSKNSSQHYRQPIMQETDLHYPPETCPFCTIAAAFPFPVSSSNSPTLWTSSKDQESSTDCVPKEEESDPEKTNPSSFVVLRSRDVVAFLDILPMTGGKFYHLLPLMG